MSLQAPIREVVTLQKGYIFFEVLQHFIDMPYLNWIREFLLQIAPTPSKTIEIIWRNHFLFVQFLKSGKRRLKFQPLFCGRIRRLGKGGLYHNLDKKQYVDYNVKYRNLSTNQLRIFAIIGMNPRASSGLLFSGASSGESDHRLRKLFS